MSPEFPSLIALPMLAFFVALPALSAWRRRRVSRAASEAAAALSAHAAAVLIAGRGLTVDAALQARLIRLGVPEQASLQLAQDLPQCDAAVLADTAQRLALRLRRRVAFERKMLARTTSGLRRGAVAASLPPLAMVSLRLAGVPLPGAAQVALLVVEVLGCLLLWRLARVEI